MGANAKKKGVAHGRVPHMVFAWTSQRDDRTWKEDDDQVRGGRGDQR